MGLYWSMMINATLFYVNTYIYCLILVRYTAGNYSGIAALYTTSCKLDKYTSK